MKKKCNIFIFRNNIYHTIVGKMIVCGFLIFHTFSIFAAKDVCIRVSTVLGETKGNLLFTEKLPEIYSKLIVDVQCELGGERLILPSSAELIIEGKGHIDNGIIEGNKSVLSVTTQKPVIGLNILILGMA